MAPGGAAAKEAKRKESTSSTSKPHVQPDKFCEATGKGRWIYLSRLGCGAYGETWKVRDVRNGDIVCLKVAKTYKSDESQDHISAFQMHEEASASMELLQNPKHPNYDPDKASLFVKYLEDHTKFRDYSYAEGAAWMNPVANWTWNGSDLKLTAEDGPQYVVMEYLDSSTLRDVLKKEELSRRMIRNVSLKVALAIEYLLSFDPPMIHRDIRVHNIMVNGDDVKVIDLGLLIRCRPFYDVNPNPCLYLKTSNQQYWVPAEVTNAWLAKPVEAKNYSYPISSFDIYSLGVLCVEMLSDPKTFFQESSKTRVSVSDVVAEGWQSLGWSDTNTLVLMVSEEPAKRPSPQQVFRELTEGIGYKTVPLGYMTGRYFRNAKIAKFLNLTHKLCCLLNPKMVAEIGSEKAQNEHENVKQELSTTFMDLIRGNYAFVCMKHFLTVVSSDDCVDGTAAYPNYIQILKFIHYLLTSHEENRAIVIPMFEAECSIRKSSYIELIWLSHAPGPQNIMEKWRAEGWFSKLRRFRADETHQVHHGGLQRTFLRPHKKMRLTK